MLNPSELKKIDAYWRASNYRAAGQLYLLDNPMLRRPLTRDDVKKKIVGHWGTVPGQNFVYVHLNRVIKKYDEDMILISGRATEDFLSPTLTWMAPTLKFTPTSAVMKRA